MSVEGHAAKVGRHNMEITDERDGDFRARCSCGWVGPLAALREVADEDAAVHLRKSTDYWARDGLRGLAENRIFGLRCPELGPGLHDFIAVSDLPVPSGEREDERRVYEIERDRHGLMYSGPLSIGECVRVVALDAASPVPVSREDEQA
jgi:hypothetical protein